VVARAGLEEKDTAETQRAQRKARGGVLESAGGGITVGDQHKSAGIGFWGFGSMLAITLSWSVNHSILRMILHGIISWIYVIYFALKH
jgi:hypothetical protein